MKAGLDNPVDFDAGRRIWTLRNGSGLDYAESAEVELREILSRASDCRSDSPELERGIRSWATRYHLSIQRSFLVRGFEFDRSARVLEVGSGCGGLTRFLGETFDSVTGVEGSARRAEVAALRTRDLASVEMIAAPVQELAFREPFSLVFCVGVLEYSGRFLDSRSPWDSMLQRLRRLTASDGALLLAIENPFGLKYFAGAPEDHTGIAYDGIEGYASRAKPDVATFGRARLEQMLRRAGFEQLQFFLPFPDYKVPSVVVREAAVRESPETNFGVLVERTRDRARRRREPAPFDESLGWQALGAEGLLPVFANSFLVVASPTKESSFLSAPWDAVAYSASRAPEYRTETRFIALGRPGGRVEKRRLCAWAEAAPGRPLVHRCPAGPWLEGERFDLYLLRRLRDRRARFETFAEDLRPWVEALVAHGADGRVPGEWVDAIPQNFVRTAAGALQRFDDEWTWNAPVPVPVVFARGLLQLLLGVDRARLTGLRDRGWLVRDVITQCGARLLGAFGARELRDFVEFEARLQGAIAGRPEAEARRALRRRLARPIDPPARLAREHPVRFARQSLARAFGRS